ncbi:MAG: hypothetical protein KatS3mg060_1170 [Dehalococcoidia bacterium]|nr:MAG: hypothetical protein KatS3mg060_1170 [Dehalococcoidia bacterium]
MDELIVVRSTLAPGADGAMPVALFERDPAHPGGEAFIADDRPHRVARTAAVAARLAAGTLVEVVVPPDDGATPVAPAAIASPPVEAPTRSPRRRR